MDNGNHIGQQDTSRKKYGRWILHIIALLPLIKIYLELNGAGDIFNPVQAVTQFSGDTALVFLLLTLLCTPLAVYLHWSGAAKVRRTLGLYAFFYAVLHVLTYAWLDYGWQFNLLLPEFAQKRYLWAGLLAFVLLVFLAALSMRSLKRIFGKTWRPLQRLVYLATGLVLLHVAWVVKGDLLRLSGDIWKPLAAGLLFVSLVFLRLAMPYILRRQKDA